MALPAGVPAAGQGEPLPGVTGPPPREGDVVGGELGRVAWHVSGYTCTRHAWHAAPGRASTPWPRLHSQQFCWAEPGGHWDTTQLSVVQEGNLAAIPAQVQLESARI